ncbi:MAG: tRNA threonylcarbamoyladenosine dehydratase [Bacteroidota bacterium]|nr:tRNA threonylcarbamoyladenosine dehydratase [Bacteroidota bacterium]
MHTKTELLIGQEERSKLQNSHVLIVGLGGVGGYAAEQLCRAGVGKLTLVDDDTVNQTNINRQLIADYSSIGKGKAKLFKERFLKINPEMVVHLSQVFLTDDDSLKLLKENRFDYVVDAIDTLRPKVNLIQSCVSENIKLVSSMGAGGKMNPEMVQVADISKTYNDGLARMLRKKLHKLGLYEGFSTVFSPEDIPKHAMVQKLERNKKTQVGTISYMPAIFGIYCASVVIRDLIK